MSTVAGAALFAEPPCPGSHAATTPMEPTAASRILRRLTRFPEEAAMRISSILAFSYLDKDTPLGDSWGPSHRYRHLLFAAVARECLQRMLATDQRKGDPASG